MAGKCGGEWKYPRTCDGLTCEYHAQWEYLEETDDIKFTVKTTHTDKWTGIGFSDTQKMVR